MRVNVRIREATDIEWDVKHFLTTELCESACWVR